MVNVPWDHERDRPMGGEASDSMPAPIGYLKPETEHTEEPRFIRAERRTEEWMLSVFTVPVFGSASASMPEPDLNTAARRIYETPGYAGSFEDARIKAMDDAALRVPAEGNAVAWRVDDLTAKGTECGVFKIFTDIEKVDQYVERQGSRFCKVTRLVPATLLAVERAAREKAERALIEAREDERINHEFLKNSDRRADALRVAGEALKPFAQSEHAKPKLNLGSFDSDDDDPVLLRTWSDDGQTMRCEVDITVGDFRRAREASATLATQTEAKAGTALPVQDGGAEL